MRLEIQAGVRWWRVVCHAEQFQLYFLSFGALEVS